MAESDVKATQKRINDFGYDLKVDGDYGSKSNDATLTLLDELEYYRLLDNEKKKPVVTKVIEAIKEPRTKHFILAEFKCKDGTPVPKELWGNVQRLMDKLEVLRAELCRVYGGDRAIYINSAYRHLIYNRKIGSKDTSQHVPAKAVDIRVKGLTPYQVWKVADKIFSDGGVGIYDTFVHVDIRNGKARWDNRK